MFGAKDVKETQGGGYIKPGIHEVTIDSVTGGYSTTGTPKLTFKLYLKDGDSSKAQDFNIFISEKSEEMAYRKIKHIFTKVSTEENYNTVTGSTIEELAEQYDKILAGNSLRIKFTGEEYINSENKIKVRPGLGLPTFAEAIQPGSSFPVVASNESKLVYDSNNQYDYKKVAAVPDAPKLDEFGAATIEAF